MANVIASDYRAGGLFFVDEEEKKKRRAPRERFVAVDVVIGSKFESDAIRNNVLFPTFKCFKKCLIISYSIPTE